MRKMMSQQPIAVWLTPNPIFHGFHSPLLNDLSQQGSIAHWEYLQDPDEPASLTTATDCLQQYLATLSHPVHLIGHGIGGWLGLHYTRQNPDQIMSLTLLAVGTDPAFDWQAYYYSLYKHLNCPKTMILQQMVDNLFGYQNSTMTRYLVEVLRRDLVSSPSPHSLYQQWRGEKGGVDVPLLVCGNDNDIVVPSTAIKEWTHYMDSSQDRIWFTSGGHHFFHYFNPHSVGQIIRQFWQQHDPNLMPCMSHQPVGITQNSSHRF